MLIVKDDYIDEAREVGFVEGSSSSLARTFLVLSCKLNAEPEGDLKNLNLNMERYVECLRFRERYPRMNYGSLCKKIIEESEFFFTENSVRELKDAEHKRFF